MRRELLADVNIFWCRLITELFRPLPISRAHRSPNPFVTHHLKMKNNLNSWIAMPAAAAVSISVVTISAPAQAFAPVTYGYNCASNNSVSDCAIAESQFKTTVSQSASQNALQQVMFTFANIGNQAVTMTNIYFEDLLPKTLGKFVGFDTSNLGSQVVNYQEGPKSIGGDLKAFEVSFSASPINPKPLNGIGIGESLGLIFEIESGFNNPINAVITDLQNGTLRTAVKAQAFDSSGSETLVNEEVPEPLTILGSGAAIVGGAMLKRHANMKASKKKAISR